MQRKKIIGVLISGNGTNMKSLIDDCLADKVNAVVACVISNVSTSSGLKIAESLGIATYIVENYPLDESRIRSILETHKVELICLAGFLRILSKKFLSHWNTDQIINIHPSILPSFIGLHAAAQALKRGSKISGCTVHYVIPELDEGPIIYQAVVPVLQTDTADILAARILKAENIVFPKVIRMVVDGVVWLDESNVVRTANSVNLHSYFSMDELKALC